MTVGALDDATVEVTRQRIFDMACTLRAGCSSRESGLPESLVRGGASIIEDVRTCSAAVRESEVDDIHTASCITAGSVVVPVALLMAVATGADGDALLAATVAGYETMIRVGAAIDGANRVYAGVWPSYFAAPIGAAATAARVLGLDDKATADALALAAMRATGVGGTPGREPSGRWLMFGAAAADGTFAALAASQGFVGDCSIFEGGLARAADLVVERLTAELGRNWAIDGVDVKPFCTARQIQAAVEAVQSATAALDDAEIDHIVVGVPGQYRHMIDRPSPATRLEAIASVQYQIALALTRPGSLHDIRRSALATDARMRHIIERVEVVEAPELTQLYPDQWGAAVEVHTAIGTHESRSITSPLGSADNPLDWAGLTAKHVKINPGDEQTDALMLMCRGLNADSANHDIADLLERAYPVSR